MTYALTLRCDGRREYIERTVWSIRDHLPPIDDKFIIDDSGDPIYAEWLDKTFPDFECIHHARRTGLGGCFRASLETVIARTDADFAFMVEDDTPLLADIDLDAMATVLQQHRHLSQLMLLRPPCNAEEIQAGGVFQNAPSAFAEHSDGIHTWVEHDTWYGFQPNLTPVSVIELMLAKSRNFLELGVTEPLKAAGYNFGYWGGLNDEPLCGFLGVQRSNGWRL